MSFAGRCVGAWKKHVSTSSRVTDRAHAWYLRAVKPEGGQTGGWSNVARKTPHDPTRPLQSILAPPFSPTVRRSKPLSLLSLSSVSLSLSPLSLSLSLCPRIRLRVSRGGPVGSEAGPHFSISRRPCASWYDTRLPYTCAVGAVTARHGMKVGPGAKGKWLRRGNGSKGEMAPRAATSLGGVQSSSASSAGRAPRVS